MNTAQDIKWKLRSKESEIYDLIQEMNSLKEELDDPDRSDSYKRSAQLRINTIRMKIGSMKNAVQDECKRIIDWNRAEMLKGNRLKAADITEDAKLFNLGVTLPVEEVEAIFDRNAGNLTMQRLAQLYASQHDMKMSGNRIIVNEEVQAMNNIENTANLYIDHWIDKPNAYEMLEKFFPEEKGERA